MSRDDLRHRTRSELATLARQEGVSGWHRMRKDELVNALTKVLPAGSDRESASHNHASAGTLARDLAPAMGADRDEIHVSVCATCWVRVSWSIVETTLQRASAALGADWYRANLVLQLLDVGEDEHPTGATTHVADIPIPSHVNEWFVTVPRLNRSYRLRYGAVSPGGRFFCMVSSPPVHVPATVTSSKSPTSAGASERAAAAAETDAPRMFGRTSGPVSDDALPLEISVELVVRGRTAPTADVTVDDQPVRLASDGSFEYRSDFPDGRHVLPIVTVARQDGLQQTVVLAVEKNVRRLEMQRLND